MGSIPNVVGQEEEEKAACFVNSLLTDGCKFGVLKAVIDLNVFQIIKQHGHDARMSAAEIVDKLHTKNSEFAATTLGRLLDFLGSHSVINVTPFTVPDGAVEKRYGLTPACEFFIPNEDGVSMAPLTNAPMYKALVDSTLSLKDAILEGEEPFKKAHGMTLYEFSGKHPEYQGDFHKSMSDHSTLVMCQILKTYKGFEGLSTLVDVGGGNGTTLNMIRTQYPTIKGTNFDLPYVVAKAPSYTGVEHVGGDMFTSIPKADAIVLKWICHCFSDEASLKILKNCYEALPEKSGKVIMIEYLLPEAHETNANDIAANSVIQFDVMMMVLHGGKERTANDFKKLALAAGFQGFQVVCSAYNVKVMELLKVV